MNLQEMKAQLVRHEGLYMCPANAPNDGPNTGFRYAEADGQLLAGYGSRPIQTTNFQHLLIRQFRNILSRLSFGALLKPLRIGVNHLLAHSCQLKVCNSVIESYSVAMVHCHSRWDATYKVFIDEPMHQWPIGLSGTALPQRHAGISSALDCYRTSCATPKSIEPSHLTGIAYFVSFFKSKNWCPHECRSA